MRLDLLKDRIAERILILNDISVGLLTRLYNIKLNLQTNNYKPQILNDNNLDGLKKEVEKKYPLNHSQVIDLYRPLVTRRNEIRKQLSLYYDTFSDVFDYHIKSTELLAEINVVELLFNLKTTTRLTMSFLNFLSNFICVHLLFSTIPNRKLVTTFYIAVDIVNDHRPDELHHKLEQFIHEYERPIGQLQKELYTYSNTFKLCLSSLRELCGQRFGSIDKWKTSYLFNVTINAPQLDTISLYDHVAWQLIAQSSLEKWIILITVVCPKTLESGDVEDCLRLAVSPYSSLCISLFRDELLPAPHVHAFLMEHLFHEKNEMRRIQDMIRDAHVDSVKRANYIHLERRHYLMKQLTNLVNVFREMPSALAPKALLCYSAIQYSMDEAIWLIRHYEWTLTPQSLVCLSRGGVGAACQKNSSTNVQMTSQMIERKKSEVLDKSLPKLLYLCEELKCLLLQHSSISTSSIIPLYYIRLLQSNHFVSLVLNIKTIYDCTIRANTSSFGESTIQIVPNEPSTTSTKKVKLDYYTNILFNNLLTNIYCLNIERHQENDENKNLDESLDEENTLQRNGKSDGNKSPLHRHNQELIKSYSIDSLRYQILCSYQKNHGNFDENRESLMRILNEIDTYSLLIETNSKQLTDLCDLSIFCFYDVQLNTRFQLCLRDVRHSSFIIVFPLICRHFLNSTHRMCPEEIGMIGDRSFATADTFLTEISRSIRTYLCDIAATRCIDTEQQEQEASAAIIACDELTDSLNNLQKEASLKKNTFRRGKKKKKKRQNNHHQIVHSLGYHFTRSDFLVQTNEVSNSAINRLFSEAQMSTKDIGYSSQSFRMEHLHDNLTYLKRQQFTDMLSSIAQVDKLNVWTQQLSPSDYFEHWLERKLIRMASAISTDRHRDFQDNLCCKRPQNLLRILIHYMETVQFASNRIRVDLSPMLSDILLQETQKEDIFKLETITDIFARFYHLRIIEGAADGLVVYSRHRECFVNLQHMIRRYKTINLNVTSKEKENKDNSNSTSNSSNSTSPFNTPYTPSSILSSNVSSDGAIRGWTFFPSKILKGFKFDAEEYTNFYELLALATVIGVYGVEYIFNKFSEHIRLLWRQMLDCVENNSESISSFANNYTDHERMEEIVNKMKQIPDFLIHLKHIGLLLHFKQLLQAAIKRVLLKRQTYLLKSLNQFPSKPFDDNNKKQNMLMEQLKCSVGLTKMFDRLFIKYIQTHYENYSKKQKLELIQSILLFLASTIRYLADDPKSIYLPSYGAHCNNIHCIGRALNFLVENMKYAWNITNEDILSFSEHFLAMSSLNIQRLGFQSERRLNLFNQTHLFPSISSLQLNFNSKFMSINSNFTHSFTTQQHSLLRIRYSLLILLDLIVKECPFLHLSNIEIYLPTPLLITAYNYLTTQEYLF
ncbi:hypothetical protein SNEBB_011231 [Seison nebaliae]|nr:hypothetical protein SNEBB_011231 [Seison nebaliae]